MRQALWPIIFPMSGWGSMPTRVGFLIEMVRKKGTIGFFGLFLQSVFITGNFLFAPSSADFNLTMLWGEALFMNEPSDKSFRAHWDGILAREGLLDVIKLFDDRELNPTSTSKVKEGKTSFL